jgi:pentapeptide MXKDX repeat protein
MVRTTRLPAIAFALASTVMFAAGPVSAEDAMKPADPMAADAMKADCMEKAGMETDAMKKEEAMKVCDDMAMKGDAMKPAGDAMGSDAMKPATDAMKPATSN